MLTLVAVLAGLVVLNVRDRLAAPSLPVIAEASTALHPVLAGSARSATVAVDGPVQARPPENGDAGETGGSRPALRTLRPLMEERGGDPFNPPSPQQPSAPTPLAATPPPVRLSPASTQPAMPAVPVTAPPAPLAALRPPSEFLGMIVDDRGPAVFVATPQGVLVGRSGSSIDGQWRIRSIDPRSIDLLHVPTGQSVQVGLTHLNVKP
jgi:hypothetical protein